MAEESLQERLSAILSAPRRWLFAPLPHDIISHNCHYLLLPRNAVNSDPADLASSTVP